MQNLWFYFAALLAAVGMIYGLNAWLNGKVKDGEYAAVAITGAYLLLVCGLVDLVL